LSDPRLERWLDALLSTPGLTSITDPDDARRVHLEESLAAVEHVRGVGGPIIDVG
jgi:16S rRNA G527 N7-methylase RsmG